MAIARPASWLAARIGHRPVLTAGAVSWAAGAAGLAVLIGGSPDWAARWLPVTLLLGLGIGLTLPVQAGAAVATLAPARLALGSAVSSSFRQLGAVLGVSVFAALLGAATGTAEIRAYHHLWLVFAVLSLASGAVLYRPRFRRGPTSPRDPAR